MKRMGAIWLAIIFGMVVMILPGQAGEPTPAPAPDKAKHGFQAADTNADGKVSCAEMSEAMCREAFAKMDKDGDRTVTRDEWAAADKAPDAKARFDAVDKNKDGSVTFLEFSQSARKSANIDKTFSTLDKNGDGTLSQDEYSGHPHFQLLSIKF